MADTRENEIIHNLILARELRRQGPSWNRAFRRELWRRLGAGLGKPPLGVRRPIDTHGMADWYGR